MNTSLLRVWFPAPGCGTACLCSKQQVLTKQTWTLFIHWGTCPITPINAEPAYLLGDLHTNQSTKGHAAPLGDILQNQDQPLSVLLVTVTPHPLWDSKSA